MKQSRLHCKLVSTGKMKKSHLSFIAEAWQNYLNYCRTVTTCILLNKNKDKLIKKTPCVKKKKGR